MQLPRINIIGRDVERFFDNPFVILTCILSLVGGIVALCVFSLKIWPEERACKALAEMYEVETRMVSTECYLKDKSKGWVSRFTFESSIRYGR